MNKHIQEALVAYFSEFLNDCYLQILIEVITHGNFHRIKLKQSQIKIDVYKFIPEGFDFDDYDVPSATWFTLSGLIKNMWAGYKWEPFAVRMDMLFKSVGYKIENTHSYEIQKHLTIRNCAQHHEGRLKEEPLKRLGRRSIELKNESGSYTIEEWETIELHEQEIYSFCNILKTFVSHFHEYIDKRIPSRQYKKIGIRHYVRSINILVMLFRKLYFSEIGMVYCLFFLT